METKGFRIQLTVPTQSSRVQPKGFKAKSLGRFRVDATIVTEAPVNFPIMKTYSIIRFYAGVLTGATA